MLWYPTQGMDAIRFTRTMLERCNRKTEVAELEDCGPALAALALEPREALVLAGQIACEQIDPASEARMGAQVHQRYENGFALSERPDPRLQAVGQKLSGHATRPLDWRFSVVESQEQQAQSIYGGYIYATRGILQAFPMEAQLAFILSHEMAHLENRAQVVQRGQKTLVTLLRNAGEDTARLEQEWVKLQRAEEYQADHRAVELMRQAGYPAEAALQVLSSWDEEDDAHGPPAERVEQLRQTVRG